MTEASEPSAAFLTHPLGRLSEELIWFKWSDFPTFLLLVGQLRADTILNTAQCFRNEFWAHFFDS